MNVPVAAPAAALPAMPAARWLRGTTVQGSIVYARTSNGRNRRVAQYNQARDEWVVTRRGREYYDEYPVDFVVNVPVIAYFQRNLQWVQAQSGMNGEPYRKIMPFNLTTLRNAATAAIIDRIVDHMTADQLNRIVGQVWAAYAASQPQHDGIGEAVLNIESGLHWTRDPGQPVTVDELIAYDAGPRDILEVLENRPLLGVPVFPNGMYRVQGLHPLAKEDLTTRGGCMLVQIVECLTKSVKVNPPRVQVDGVRVRQGKQTRETRPMVTID